MDITAIMLSAVIVMFTLSAPRGRTRNVPLGFSAGLALLAVVYALGNHEPVFYVMAAIALAKGVHVYSRWRSD